MKNLDESVTDEYSSKCLSKYYNCLYLIRQSKLCTFRLSFSPTLESIKFTRIELKLYHIYDDTIFLIPEQIFLIS